MRYLSLFIKSSYKHDIIGKTRGGKEMALFKKRHVKPIFVGSYGNDITRGMYVFHLDIDNGELIKKKFYKTIANPTAMFKRERFIFACYKNRTGRNTDGGLWQYASMDLQFGLAAKVTDHGKTYMCCYVDEQRKYAYAVDYYNGEVVVIPFVNQKIVKVVQTIKHEGHGPVQRRQEQAHPHYVEMLPNKERLFVCDLGTDEIVLYKIVENGRLERDEENSFHVKPGNGPKKMVFSSDGRFAYVLNELSSTVSIYAMDGLQFTLVGEVDTYPKDNYEGENTAGDIIINEEGDYLFVSNRGYDAISTFEVDTQTGQLYYLEYIDTDENPRSMILVNNRWIVSASQKGGMLETFEIKRGEQRGVLFETHFSYPVGEPVCLIEGRGI